ncbi:hypothetical protein VB773_07425 [Haloarculaceae archaeon H-GB2-1]|nr:hypothetical protein [Haloarculaceae archaeon H-GB1-1]MEA5385906.1 hypothetical protein [Haloarculaceae archaeon H-GB11]MEA5407413.1 hypothetical protein [Haloarculaceae archaeon H-GB2-1]
MADEFAKGFGILSGAGLIWMVLAGWYRTPSFEGAQLSGAILVESPTVYDKIGFFLMDAMFWFAVIGTLTFWVLIPAIERARATLAERGE